MTRDEARVQWIVVRETRDGFETGYVTCDGEPQFDFDRDLVTGEYRTCGYGQGCFWSEWRGGQEDG